MIIKKILLFFIKNFPPLTKAKDEYESQRRKKQIEKIINIFTKKDFEIKKKDNKYKIIFNNKFGYKKVNYSPLFYYDKEKERWVVKVEGLTIFCQQNPCFNLINELRGYTLLNNIKKGDIIIDAGASDGFISCYFAKKVGQSGNIVSLEPDPHFQKLLKENIRINKLGNLTIIAKALFSRSGKANFQLESSGASRVGKNGSLEVESITFGSLINNLKLSEKKIKLIKLDIEGGEIDVIDDLISFVSKNTQCVACIASYHQVNKQPAYKAIEKKCKKRKNIFVKTVYPYHTTTLILNKKSKLIKKLKALPSYEKMNKKIWPKA